MKNKKITRKITLGMYVLTTNGGGCVVDAVSQISSGDEPLIAVSVMKGNYTNENIGYNILNGGISGFKMIMSEESRKKISQTNKLKPKEQHPMYGKHLSEEWKKEISNSMKGKVKTQEHREKLSKSMKGKFVSDETKSKIRQARLGTKLKEETKLKISESMKRYKNLNKSLDQIATTE